MKQQTKNFKLETVSIAESLQNRQHAQNATAVNNREGSRDIRRVEGREGGIVR